MIRNGAGAVGGWGSGLRGRGWHILLFAIVLGGTSSAQLTKRVSKSSSEVPGNDDSNAGGGDRCVSADGRFVVFSSRATDLVPGDTNGAWDVFVHDRQTGTTERVSVAPGGAQADYDSSGAPPVATLTRSVVPVCRSWTKTSQAPFESPGTR